MSTDIGKTPFFRLLLPLTAGIVVCYYLPEFSLISKYLTGATGLILILFSLFVKKEYRFKFRWLFGAGLFLFIFSLSQLQYQQQEQHAQFSFSENEQYYLGTITDIPETKPRTIAYNVKINNPSEKKVILYIQQSEQAWELEPGDEIVFSARIQPFKNFDDAGDFDYPRYMKIKGYSGSAYIPETAWRKTGRSSFSITSASQKFRVKALDFYKSFEPDKEAYAFISALTLGYKEDLTDSMQEVDRKSVV